MAGLIRPLKARDPSEDHRAATQLELFFDLIVVIAIAAITASFHHAITDGHGLDAIPNFLLLFMGIWWVWMNFTWFASAFDNDDVLYRLLVILMMTGALIYAGGVDYIFKSLDFSIGIVGWVIMRLCLMVLWGRAARNTTEHKNTAMRYIWGLGVVQLLWVVAYFTFPAASEGFLIAAVVLFGLELFIPVFAEKASSTPWHRHHIIERYGLLNIIVLGEVLLSVSFAVAALYEGHIDGEMLALIASGLLIVFSLWWIYFVEHEHLKSKQMKHAFVWGYMHFFIFGAVAALGAGLAAYLDILGDHSKLTRDQVIYFIGIPVAIYLLGIWIARDMFHDLGATKFALPAIALLIILATWLGASPLIIAGLCVLCLIWRLPFSEKTD